MKKKNKNQSYASVYGCKCTNGPIYSDYETLKWHFCSYLPAVIPISDTESAPQDQQ